LNPSGLFGNFAALQQGTTAIGHSTIITDSHGDTLTFGRGFINVIDGGAVGVLMAAAIRLGSETLHVPDQHDRIRPRRWRAWRVAMVGRA
jgi:hypothetical protein